MSSRRVSWTRCATSSGWRTRPADDRGHRRSTAPWYGAPQARWDAYAAQLMTGGWRALQELRSAGVTRGIGAAIAERLASDECSFSTGAVFDISGGRATY